MFSKYRQYNLVTKFLASIFISTLLIACGGDSSNSDRHEVIDRSVNIDGEEINESSIANEDGESTVTFNLIDNEGNTVSCDSSEVEFDADNQPSCPNAE